MKRKPIKWKGNFVEYLLKKELISRMYIKNSNSKERLKLDQRALYA